MFQKIKSKLRSTLVVALVGLMALSAIVFIIAAAVPGASYDPGKVKLKIDVHARERILTCAYKIYGNDQAEMWAAKTIIKNVGKMPVYDFKISYAVKGFTDWTSTEEYPVICPGETVRDYCWPSLDPDKVKEITTKTDVDLVMRYSYRGKAEPTEDYQKITLMGTNDFVWTSFDDKDIVTYQDTLDNYGFLASFVTPHEEVTQEFASRVGSGLETATTEHDAMQAFVRCFYNLRDYGVKYYQPSATFWDGTQTQYIRYPKDVIEKKTGTCVDLAITMAAIMEALNVKSYVALIPGHAIPVIQLPESGDLIPIESTFLDKEYALSHYPGLTTPDVTADECITDAVKTLNDAQEKGEMILVDIRYWWEAGVVPPW